MLMISRRILPARSAISPDGRPFAGRSEDRGDDLDVPVHRELGPRAQLAEAALREADEIEPQQRVVCAPGNLSAAVILRV
jgi:hypothetical protein